MIDEEKRWETILAQTCTVSGEQGTVPMTMTELLEWLESERGFLRREAAAAFLSQFQRATVHRNESTLTASEQFKLPSVFYRGLVQLVEHQSPKLSVGGSSPPAPAINF